MRVQRRTITLELFFRNMSTLGREGGDIGLEIKLVLIFSKEMLSLSYSLAKKLWIIFRLAGFKLVLSKS